MVRYVRITDVLYKYWDELREDHHLPDLSLVNLNCGELEPVKDDMFLLQVNETEGAADYVMLYIGKNIQTLFNQKTEDHSSNQLFVLFDEFLSDKFNEIYFSHKPIIVEEEYNAGNGYSIKFRQCMMPLGNASNDINGIIGGMRYKIDHDAHDDDAALAP